MRMTFVLSVAAALALQGASLAAQAKPQPLGFFITSNALPAWAMLIYWAALQAFGGITSITATSTGGVAFWAHLGGFVAGVVLVKLFERPDRLAQHKSHHWRPERVGWR